MLRTGKQVWEANAKRRALTLRQEELDFYMQRYSILITQCSILAGFAFESIVATIRTGDERKTTGASAVEPRVRAVNDGVQVAVGCTANGCRRPRTDTILALT